MLSSNSIRSFLLFSYLCTSSITIPHQANAFNIEINDINIGVKVKKIVDKVKKYKKSKDVDKMMSILFDAKDLVYEFTGKKLDFSDILDQVAHELKHNKKSKVTKDDFKAYKEKLKSYEKKHKHRKEFKALCVSAGLPYDLNWADEVFYAGHSKHKHSEDKVEIDIPVHMAVGITIALVGFFLKFIPHPLCQEGGSVCLLIGIEMAINSGCDRFEQQKQKEKEDKK